MSYIICFQNMLPNFGPLFIKQDTGHCAVLRWLSASWLSARFFVLSIARLPKEASSRISKSWVFPKLLRSWNFCWAEGLSRASVGFRRDGRPVDTCLLWRSYGTSLVYFWLQSWCFITCAPWSILGGICKCLKLLIWQDRLNSKDVVTMILRKQLSERNVSSPQTEAKPENRWACFLPRNRGQKVQCTSVKCKV